MLRLLLVAYDFPPIPSPQSLRWAYLVRELASVGHDIHVLVPDVAAYGAGDLPDLPECVRVHRVYPGPLMGFIAARQRKSLVMLAGRAAAHAENRSKGIESQDVSPAKLNWKGRAVEMIKRALGLWMFPDARAEWMPWARRKLDELLDEVGPDAVITSHEPANSIELGIHAKRRGFRWIADLGDPVLAAYTPRRWRRRAYSLERALCEQADVVTVTSAATAQVMADRHALPMSRCAVVTQGFDGAFAMSPEDRHAAIFDPERLELVYTGSFYSFRRIGELLQAIIDTGDVRLTVATMLAPPEIMSAARNHPDKVRLLGFLGHKQALVLQRKCDVLVNLANDDPVQVPGKLYEYLGAGVPVLQVGGSPADASMHLLKETGVGVYRPNDYQALCELLLGWVQYKKTHGRLAHVLPSDDVLGRYAWSTLAARVSELAQGASVCR